MTLHLSPSSFSLTELEKGIQGLIVMSTSLEEIFNCIFDCRQSRCVDGDLPSQRVLLRLFLSSTRGRKSMMISPSEMMFCCVLFWLLYD